MKKSNRKITAVIMAALLASGALQMSAAVKPVTVSAAEGVSAKQYYVTSEVLNVRSGPDTAYSVLGTLTRGIRVNVYSIRGEKGNRWAKIRFQGLTAYVSAKHLAKSR